MAITRAPIAFSGSIRRYDLLGLAALAEEERDVLLPDAAEVAVQGLGRVQEQALRAGRGEGRGELLADQSRTCRPRKPRSFPGIRAASATARSNGLPSVGTRFRMACASIDRTSRA